METLTLPEPARTLWLAKREIIRDLPDEGTGRKVTPHLGGGTTLAARWKHRVSTDIDILLPGRNTLIDLAQDNDDNIARRLGGSPVAVSGSRIKVGFADGEIDLTTLRPMPSEGHRESQVEGRTEIVLANAQILRGKLERAEKLHVRDVVDVIVASKADPASLATAVSLLGPERAAAIQALWTNGNRDLANDFEERIRDLDPRFGVDRETVGSAAAQLLGGHRYRRIEIDADGDRLTIRRTIAAGTLPVEHYSRAHAGKALIESGIGEHLNNNGPITAPQLLRAIRTADQMFAGRVFDSAGAGSVS